MQLPFDFLLTNAELCAQVVRAGEVATDAEAQAVGQRIDEVWALAEGRYQEGGRPLRFLGCSYYVVDSGQMSDRGAYLSQAESDEVHRLTLLHSLYVNDPARARARNQQRIAARRQAQAAKQKALLTTLN